MINRKIVADNKVLPFQERWVSLNDEPIEKIKEFMLAILRHEEIRNRFAFYYRDVNKKSPSKEIVIDYINMMNGSGEARFVYGQKMWFYTEDSSVEAPSIRFLIKYMEIKDENDRPIFDVFVPCTTENIYLLFSDFQNVFGIKFIDYPSFYELP